MLIRTVLSIAGFSVLAVSTVSAAEHTADEMVVTAARTALELSRVPSATTVIDAEDLERRQARYLTDLLRQVPGFAVSRSGVEGAFTEVRVRGSEANQVLVLIDGVRVNDPALGDSFRWEQLTTANIERIEIVRGPQSAIWGTDAVGAVVNIISKKGADAFSADGFVERGSDHASGGGFSSRFSLGEVKINAALERIKTAGESIARDGSEDDDSDTTTASLGASYAVTDNLGIDFSVRKVDAFSQYDASDFGTGLPADSNTATDNETLSARAQVRLATFEDKVTHTVAVEWYDSKNINRTDNIEDARSESDRLTLGWQSDIRFGEDILSLALEHEETDYKQRGMSLFGDPNQDQSMDVSSVVADYQGQLSARLSWFVSARYDDNSDFENATTGRGALSYALSDTTRLRASYGTARKNPTFTERFGFFPEDFIGNEDLDPERSESFEIGIDQSLLNDALNLQLSWYQQNLKDEITTVFLGGGLSTAQNLDGESDRDGVEVAASWALNRQLDLRAAYSYVDAKEQRTPGLETREVRRPQHTGSLQAAWRSDNGRLDTVLSADYSGSRYDLFFGPPTFNETVKLDSYWLVDATLQYQLTDEVTLLVRGQNLLDEDYEEVFGYNTPDRSAYIGFRARIGN